MFAERTHIHTALYDYAWSVAERLTTARRPSSRSTATTPASSSTSASWPRARRSPTSRRGRAEWAPKRDGASRGDPDLIVQRHAAAAARRRAADVPRIPNADRRFLQLHFLDPRPRREWADGYGQFGEQLDASGSATHLWTGAVHPDRVRHRHRTPTSSGSAGPCIGATTWTDHRQADPRHRRDRLGGRSRRRRPRGNGNKVYGAARFKDASQREPLEAPGVHTVSVDLGAGRFDEVPAGLDLVLQLRRRPRSSSST